MSDYTPSTQELWARLRFSIVGRLLSGPPSEGELEDALRELAARQWNHPTQPGKTKSFSFSTLEKWYYRARASRNPIDALRGLVRKDAGSSKAVRKEHETILREQHKDYAGWSYQLHHDNLLVRTQQDPKLGPAPSYSSVRRFMKARGLRRTKRRGNEHRPGLALAREALDQREVRSYEVEFVGGLWHLDFHTSRHIGVLDPDGNWVKPKLLAILDDHSRLCCHAQFYFEETTEVLVHGFSQALLKHDVPRKLMTDNGAAMTSHEFVQGLENLSIEHELTIPYSPHQNGKQEHFWHVVEGRFLAQLDRMRELTLDDLNRFLQAWIERGYHQDVHSQTKEKPRERFAHGVSVLRPTPDLEALRMAFRKRATRRVRRSDATIMLEGTRYEIPAAYRHRDHLTLVYARWDMSYVHLFDSREGKSLVRVFPLDRHRNASGERRRLDPTEPSSVFEESSSSLPPLLQRLVDDYEANGLPPAHLSFPTKTTDEEQDS